MIKSESQSQVIVNSDFLHSLSPKQVLQLELTQTQVYLQIRMVWNRGPNWIPNFTQSMKGRMAILGVSKKYTKLDKQNLKIDNV